MLTTFQIIQITLPSIAIILTLLFRYIDKKRKKLFYIVRNRIIIENKLTDKGLILTYNNEKTEKLLQTEILIFNKSKVTIKYEELGATLGLQLIFSDKTTLYNLEITEYNNPNVNLTCSQSENRVNLIFDYFKTENYVLLKFLTNENDNSKPEMLGEFINNDKLVKFNSFKYIISQLVRALPLIFICSLPLTFITDYLKFKREINFLIMFLFGFFVIYFIMKIMDKKIDKRIKDMVTE